LAIALAHFYHAKTSFFLDELSLPIRSIELLYSLPQFDIFLLRVTAREEREILIQAYHSDFRDFL